MKLAGWDLLKAVLTPPALVAVGVSAAILLTLLAVSLDAWVNQGPQAIFSFEWKPSEEERGTYGILIPLAGTMIVGLLATLITSTFSMAVTLYIREYAPRFWGTLIEATLYAMAALPTIVYGVWGLQVLSPAIRSSGLALLCARGSPTGQSAFTAALTVGLMMTPYSTAMVLEAYRAVPFTYVEALHSLGAKGFERARVLLGIIKKSILASVLLSFGRAVGETTIVALTIGSSMNIPLCLFEPAHTISSLIVSQLGNAYLFPGLEGALSAAALLMLLVSSASIAIGMVLARRTLKALGGENA